mmetsp:Transcript_86483/g.245239  ORF Transcript_86483/g.245239 Transcript_86483/m.245239 type:complete len:385 (-) Transcript_86483:76-1230(-)
MSAPTNLYVGGLPDGLDETAFKQLFEGFGNIESCKLYPERRYGFVKFSSHDEAQSALNAANGTSFGASTLVVKFDDYRGKGGKGDAASGSSWGGDDSSAPFKGGKGGKSLVPTDQVYLKGLPAGFDDVQLRDIFGKYGNVTWSKVLRADGKGDTAALVQLASIDEAQWLVDNLDGNIPQGLTSPIVVQFSRPPGATKGKGKHEANFKGKGDGRYSPYGGGGGTGPPNGHGGDDESNLYVKGLPQEADELYLYKLFAPFGGVSSVKVLSQEWNPIGFVKYNYGADALQAIQAINGQTQPDGSVILVSVKTNKKKGAGKGDWRNDTALADQLQQALPAELWTGLIQAATAIAAASTLSAPATELAADAARADAAHADVAQTENWEL